MSAITDLSPDERRARVMLSLLAEPDDPLTGRLVRKAGAAEALRLLDGDGPVPGLNRVDSQVWRDRLSLRTRRDDVAGRLNSIERSGITVLIPDDEHWPGALDDLGDRAPYVLFARGATSFLTRPMSNLVTVTGARASTGYGEQVATQLAAGLAANERVTVAGGAYGIEGAVHRATLAAGGDTIAVLAGGVDRPYPNGHRELLDRVADVGVLVSELPPESAPTRQRFLARSRLMAALSGATVVVEAGARSGPPRVATEAHRLGRGVGAVPGPVTSVNSIGPHELVRTGVGRLVTSVTDVEQLVSHPEGGRTALAPQFHRLEAPGTEAATLSM